MRFRRWMSALLLGTGCATWFIGLLAYALSRTGNHQLRLIAASFDVPSRYALVNAVNAVFRFSLEQSVQVFLAGMFLSIVGGYLVAFFSDSGRSKTER